MALRLNDLVEAGEVFNTRNYSVHGWLKLRGRAEPLVSDLTGNCSADAEVTEAFFSAPDDDEAEEGSPDDPCGLFPPDLQRQEEV